MTDPDTRQNTAPQTTDRDALRVRFAAAHLGEGPALQAMPADASFRRYFRVEGADRPLLVMDAPPSHENLPAYLRIARYLHEHGFAAPEVLASDVEQGFALIEDFGDSTYTRLLAAEADEAALYRLAVEVLAGLHAAPPPATGREGFAAYDMASLLDEAALFPDWYWEHITGSAATPWQRQRFLGLMHEAVGITAGRRETLVLRDYHIDNLMLRPGQPQGAVASCGLLDFQDGLVGARAYDLMSLLEDARRDIDAGLIEAMKAHYLALCPPGDAAVFERDYRVLAATRHAKVLGIFVRLNKRDGKPKYLAHLPRVARLFAQALQQPYQAELADFLDRECTGWREPQPVAR